MSPIGEVLMPYVRAGLSPMEIAIQNGINPDTIRGTLSRLRREGVSVPKHSRGGKPFPLSAEARSALMLEAADRGITLRQLYGMLLDAIGLEGMVDAVLDDPEHRAR